MSAMLVYSAGHAGVKNKQADRLAGKWSKNHNRPAAWQAGDAESLEEPSEHNKPEHHRIDLLNKRVTEKRIGERARLKDWGRSELNQTKTDPVSRSTTGLNELVSSASRGEAQFSY